MLINILQRNQLYIKLNPSILKINNSIKNPREGLEILGINENW